MERCSSSMSFASSAPSRAATSCGDGWPSGISLASSVGELSTAKGDSIDPSRAVSCIEDAVLMPSAKTAMDKGLIPCILGVLAWTVVFWS
eukprot:6202906-Alexandrium_andersonii.AAC.1